MATHDYVISNASGAAVRADLNNALAAIVSNNSNATEPSTTYSYMLWADTGSSPPVMKLRNAANDGWVTLFQLDGEWSTLAVEDGTAAAPSIYFKDSGADTGFFSSGTDEVAITTGGTQRATIDSSGRLLVGTSSNSNSNARLLVQSNSDSSTGPGALDIRLGTTRPAAADATIGSIRFSSTSQTSASNVYAQILALSDGASSSDGDIPGRLEFSTTPSGGASPVERMRISANGELAVPAVYNDTTANAANVNVSAAGLLNRSTSSRKYKTNVETLEDSYADAILDVRPVWYRSTCQNDSPKHSWWGFIAEEVAEIDPRLVQWKTTEPVIQENGSLKHVPCDPEPEGVAYDRFVPHLLNLIKRQKEQIETLETKVAALEAA